MGAAAVFAIGAAISAYGMHKQAGAARAVGRYQQRVSEMAAASAEEAGERQAARHGMRIRALVGRQSVGYSASGLQVGTGTQEKLVNWTRRVGSEEVADIRLNAAREAWGLRSRGTAAAIQGRLTAKAMNVQAIGSLVQGIGGAFGIASETGGWWNWGAKSAKTAATTATTAATTSVPYYLAAPGG